MEFQILIIDDKISDAKAVADILLEIARVNPVVLDNPEKALQLIEKQPERFALILTDFNFNIKNFDGLSLAKKIWKLNPQQLIAIFSGESSQDVPIKCVGTPIVEFIHKSAPATLIQKKVQNLLQKYAATYKPITNSLTDNQDLCESVGLIGKSSRLAELAKDLKKMAASSTSTVLIRGESGTGKELVARSLHNLSTRKKGPFIAINMGAFQSSLIESELFGHEKGSFTGAINTKKGAFQQASGGTIFLDEIGDLPHDLQVKLLRVLQEREVQPVGATSPIKIDVRVLAATHVNLESQIESGKFRFDLFQRLNVLSLQLPSLKERPDDIELLANHFLKNCCSSKKLNLKSLLLLEKYNWPGNVRELENLILRLNVLTDDQEIMPQHLPSEMFGHASEIVRNFDLTMKYPEMLQHLTDIEKNYYIYHLSKSKSVRDAALNRMEMPPSTLRDKMGLFKIPFKTQDLETPIITEGEINETL